MKLLTSLLRKFIHNVELKLFDSKGNLHTFGTGQNGPLVTIRLHSAVLESKLGRNPELYAAEAYMDGTLTFEDGSTCYDFLYLFSVNRGGLAAHSSQKMLRAIWRKMRRFQQSNPLGKAAKNVQHHYNLSTELYRLFLDEDMHYSCAYFLDPENETLEQAQANKIRHAASKLKLEPGMTVAEIGGGWGAFAIYLAKLGAHVTSINVSDEQVKIAIQKAEEAGVADKIDFVIQDYREFEGKFDRVVSVGMMEHVGVAYFEEYFNKISSLLKDDGIAFIHAIGRMTPPGTTGPFIRKYIFPGGYVPALSETFAAIEQTGLWVADMEVLRLHYYYTIKHWRERFEANRAEVAALYDERFCRMWEFYLCAVEMGFLHGSNMVFQFLMAKERDAVPIQRNYMFERERELIKKGL